MPGYSFKDSIFSPDNDGGFIRINYYQSLDVLEIKRYEEISQRKKISVNGYAQTSIKVNGHRIRSIRVKRTKEGEIIGLLVPNLSKRSRGTLDSLDELFEELFDYTPLKLSIRDFIK